MPDIQRPEQVQAEQDAMRDVVEKQADLLQRAVKELKDGACGRCPYEPECAGDSANCPTQHIIKEIAAALKGGGCNDDRLKSFQGGSGVAYPYEQYTIGYSYIAVSVDRLPADKAYRNQNYSGQTYNCNDGIITDTEGREWTCWCKKGERERAIREAQETISLRSRLKQAEADNAAMRDVVEAAKEWAHQLTLVSDREVPRNIFKAEKRLMRALTDCQMRCAAWKSVNAVPNQLIYLASPYSHPDPAIMQQRYEQVCEATAALLRAGHMVYSPIVHSHPLTEYGLPTEWSYWERLDTRMIAACDALWVLTLDGWKESTGVACEMRIARRLGKLIYPYAPKIGIKEAPHHERPYKSTATR